MTTTMTIPMIMELIHQMIMTMMTFYLHINSSAQPSSTLISILNPHVITNEHEQGRLGLVPPPEYTVASPSSVLGLDGGLEGAGSVRVSALPLVHGNGYPPMDEDHVGVLNGGRQGGQGQNQTQRTAECA
ncbi:hypothetical protein HDU76_001805 [Blyttiomyces sp. JEL0837]|nr:hypothetical protein HDU76_001805 [Blyttiomyces sp. JEL0837]